MSRNAHARAPRAAKRRKRRRLTRGRLRQPAKAYDAGLRQKAMRALIELWFLEATYALVVGDRPRFDMRAATLAGPGCEPELLDDVIDRRLADATRTLWERGWLPSSLIALAGRCWGNSDPCLFAYLLDAITRQAWCSDDTAYLDEWTRRHHASRNHAIATAAAVDVWLAAVSEHRGDGSDA